MAAGEFTGDLHEGKKLLRDLVAIYLLAVWSYAYRAALNKELSEKWFSDQARI